jgi:putative ABC transport system permease protein
MSDIRNAFRSLAQSRTFTVVALTVLALAIGSATAIFSVVDAVVLRALPFDEHDRLAVVLEQETLKAVTFGSGSTTPQMFLDWRQRQESFEHLAAVAGTSFRLRTETGEPADARAQRVTWEFLPTLRVAPVLGRAFGPDDEVEGRHRVAMISHGFWQRQFGGAADVVGKRIDLNEEPWEIVGVLPREFSYPVASDRPAEVFVPAVFTKEDRTRGGSRSFNWLAIGRLKPGVSLEQAHGQMYRLAEALDLEHPKWGPGRRVRVVPLRDHLVGTARSWMLLLLGAVGLVLLIACANVANLMLARATVRQREIAIRAALGASRFRLVRGLLVEGLVLALVAAVIGILLAYGGVHVIKAWLPAGLPRVASIGIDLRVLATAIAAAVATGLLFGAAPALQSSRPDLTHALKAGGRSSTTGSTSQRLRAALVVAEVALAVILLVGAGLFTASFAKLMRVDPGFDYRNVLALNVGVRFDFRKPDERKRAQIEGPIYLRRMLDAVSRVPGVVQAATVSGGVPLSGSWSRTGVELPGKPKSEQMEDDIDVRTVSPGYISLLRIPVLRGRELSTDDRSNSQPVIVINEAAARKYWPGEEALGQRIKIGDEERTVVGVVGNIRHLGLELPARQECYIPATQDDQFGATLMMKTAGDPLAVLPAVKAAIWGVNREQRLSDDTVTLEGYMDRLVAQRRFNMALLSLFGLLGLLISAVGIYGVMAYLVAQRTQEIGVRMALGATRAAIVSLVLRRAGSLIILGLVIGTAGAYALSASARTFLFEVEPANAAVFSAAVLVLTLAGLAASVVPARRAASVDPLVALRQE